MLLVLSDRDLPTSSMAIGVGVGVGVGAEYIAAQKSQSSTHSTSNDSLPTG